MCSHTYASSSHTLGCHGASRQEAPPSRAAPDRGGWKNTHPATVLQGTLGVAAFRSTCWRPRWAHSCQVAAACPVGCSARLCPPGTARAGRAPSSAEVEAALESLRCRLPPAGRPPGSAPTPRWGPGWREEALDYQGAWVARAGLPLTLPDWSAAWTLCYRVPLSSLP